MLSRKKSPLTQSPFFTTSSRAPGHASNVQIQRLRMANKPKKGPSPKKKQTAWQDQTFKKPQQATGAQIQPQQANRSSKPQGLAHNQNRTPTMPEDSHSPAAWR